MNSAAVLDEYEFLLPSKFDGGYLIVSLCEKIVRGELREPFTTNEIKQVWEEISRYYPQPGMHGIDELIHRLGRYLIRDQPGQYGSYHLTEYAKDLTEMLVQQINNPYKAYPLKDTIEGYFQIQPNDIRSFLDLDMKFGKRFVAPRLKVVSAHLDALQSELNVAYAGLGEILRSDALSATDMVQQFVSVFLQFGERAEDIRQAVATKDRFLESLRGEVEKLYWKMSDGRQPETEDEIKAAEELKADWEKAGEIRDSLESFFRDADAAIERVRRQIWYASNRLGDLQEHLNTRSEMLLRLRRMLKLALENAHCEHGNMKLSDSFPRKAMHIEKARLFVPGFHDFALPARNKVIVQATADAYYHEQSARVRQAVEQEQRIRHWVRIYKHTLQEQGKLVLYDVFQAILAQDKNTNIVVGVGYELMQFARLEARLSIEITKELLHLPGHHLYVWNTTIKNRSPLTS